MICSLIKSGISGASKHEDDGGDEDDGGGGDGDEDDGGDDDVSIRCNTAISSVCDKRENLLKQ